MRKILLFTICLLISYFTFSQAETFDNLEKFGSIRAKLNINAGIINDHSDSILQNDADISANSALISINSNNIVNYDSLQSIAQNTMLVSVSTTVDTIFTKMQKDYTINIGSSNDTLIISDDLNWNIYNDDTVNAITTIKWYNDDNVSELKFKFNDSILPYTLGVADPSRANVIQLTRFADSASFIDKCLSISTYSMPKEFTFDPSALNPDYYNPNELTFNGTNYLDIGAYPSVYNGDNYEMWMLASPDDGIPAISQYIFGVVNNNSSGQISLFIFNDQTMRLRHKNATFTSTTMITDPVWSDGQQPYKMIYIRKTGLNFYMEIDGVPISLTPSSITSNSNLLSTDYMYIGALYVGETQSVLNHYEGKVKGFFLKSGNLSSENKSLVDTYINNLK
jgi:hypothetical protein